MQNLRERFDRDLNLYGMYVEDKSEAWAWVWHHWRSEDAINLRGRLNEKWHLALDPDAELPGLETASTENTRIASEERRDNEEATANEEAPAQPRWGRTMGDWVGNPRIPVSTREDAEAEEDAQEDETLPMTFAVWCVSPLAPQNPDRGKNTYSALRSDLKAYTCYLGGYNHRASPRIYQDPIRSGHFEVRYRLDFFQRNILLPQLSSTRHLEPRSNP